MLLTRASNTVQRMSSDHTNPKKVFPALRMTTLLLFSVYLSAGAGGLPQRVTLSAINVKLDKVFKEIKKQTGYVFVCDARIMDGAKSVSIHAKDATVEEVLKECLQGQTLACSIQEKTVKIFQKENSYLTTNPRNVLIRNGENIPSIPVDIIRGTVIDGLGNHLAGVSVIVKKTKKGTSTDTGGSFSIDANVGDILEFTMVGYKKASEIVGQNKDIMVVMQIEAEVGSEIVVVGYGTQRKVDLTGSIATVSSDKLESRPLTNLGDGLEGLIPNLNVNLQNGQPGTGASYNIRGYTTINGNSSSSPLILVDGVQRDPNLIDPNDVASVTVLKDAASAAIYGGRAAYGVILITTKTGKKGATRISYTGNYTTSSPTNLPEYINSGGYIKMFNDAQRTGSLTGGSTSSDPFTSLDSSMAAAYRADPANNPDAYPDPGNPIRYRYVGNTNWVKVLYPGWVPQQEHHLSVSGGEGKTTYSANLGYLKQDGMQKITNQVYKRITPNLKINSDITKWLTVNLNMSMTHTDNNGDAGTVNGPGGSWIPGDLRPIMPVYNPDGHFAGQGNFSNPVAIIKSSGRDIGYVNDFWTTGRVILKPINHLTITSDYTWNSYTNFDKANLIPFNEYGVNGTFLDIFPWTKTSQVSEKRQNNEYTALNAYATYENTFNNKHSFKALIGYNQEYFHYRVGNSLARNLIDPTLPAIGVNNDSKPSVGGTETESALTGTFFRLNYAYNGKYLLEINGRYDGTSRFQPSDRYAFSPSVSAGWNIAKESFMQNLQETINELKIRASYGELPNQLTPAGAISSGAQYPYIATMPTGTVGYLFNNQPGVTVGTPGLISPTFTWERVQTKNIGLDYALIGAKLNGSFDYFITDTKNMVVASQQLPAVLGTSAPPSNSADLRTKGWELSLTWNDRIINNQLRYSMTLGLSDNSSTITKYSGNPTESLSDFYPGEKLGNIWGFTTEGFYKTDADASAINNSALAGYTWLAGDIKYADLNKDGKISYGDNTVANPGDQNIIGNSTPRYKFGFNLNLEYKGFDFAAFIQGVLKRDFDPKGSYVFYGFANAEWNLPYAYALDYWTPQNPNAYFARPRFGGHGNQQTQTKYLLNAAYGRVKQLTFGYTLPKQLISRWNIQKVRAYITGANLITITSLFKGFDPEIINFGGGYTTYPINKSVSFGLQVTL
ncbi:MAG: TonB-dependent receptor [Ginsengibacter sp.]